MEELEGTDDESKSIELKSSNNELYEMSWRSYVTKTVQTTRSIRDELERGDDLESVPYRLSPDRRDQGSNPAWGLCSPGRGEVLPSVSHSFVSISLYKNAKIHLKKRDELERSPRPAWSPLKSLFGVTTFVYVMVQLRSYPQSGLQSPFEVLGVNVKYSTLNHCQSV